MRWDYLHNYNIRTIYTKIGIVCFIVILLNNNGNDDGDGEIYNRFTALKARPLQRFAIPLESAHSITL